MRLDGKVAVITGSTKGIGRTIAMMFAAEGAAVLVTGRTEEAGRAVVASIEDRGGSATFVRTDMSDEDQVASVMRAAVERYGRLTTLVNNAAPIDTLHGVAGIDGTVVTMDTATWELALRLTLTSAFWACKYAVPAMIESGGGSIVNISTMGSVRGTRGGESYPVAKAALNALSREVAVDFADYGIRSNALLLGRIIADSEMAHVAERQRVLESIQLSGLGRPVDVAAAALFLASDESRYVTATEIEVDGGSGRWIPLPRRHAPL